MQRNPAHMKRAPRIGEVYLIKFDGTGSEQSGWRPGVVFQNNVGNIHSPNIIALPMTSVIKKVNLPTHVLIRAADSGIRHDSIVMCENPQRVSKEKISRYITTLSEQYMAEIAVANLIATSAISFLNREELFAAWSRAISLNSTS